MILEITYGYTVESVDDSFIHLADDAAVESFRHGGPGTTPCDILPIREEFLHISTLCLDHGSDVNTSEVLANMDAIFFLPATCCTHQDTRGETIYLATELGSTENCASFSSSLGTFRFTLFHRQVELRSHLWPRTF